MAAKSSTGFDFDMTRFLSDLRLPAMPPMPAMPGFEGLAQAQKRNMDALGAANKLALEGMQAILRRQGEIARQVVDSASDAADRLTHAQDPAARAACQIELIQEAMDQMANNLRELSELAGNSGAEVSGVFQRRMSEALDEMGEILKTLPEAVPAMTNPALMNPLLGDAALRAEVATSAAKEKAAKETAAEPAPESATPPAAKAAAAKTASQARTNGAKAAAAPAK